MATANVVDTARPASSSGTARRKGETKPKTNKQAPPPPATNKQAPPPPAIPAQPYSPGGGSGGGGGNISTNSIGSAVPMAFAAPAPAPPPPSLNDWLGTDAGYQAESAGLKGTLESALADYKAQLRNYDTDFQMGLKNLGRSGFQMDMDGDLKEDSFKSGEWDPQNQLGAYGIGATNINNDFAGRGMLNSSFFGEGRTNFDTDMNNQLSQMTQSRASERQNTGRGIGTANTDYINALQRAKADAAARAEAQYGQKLV